MLIGALLQNCGNWHDIFAQDIMQMFIKKLYIFDLSDKNKEAVSLNWQDCQELLDYTKRTLAKNNANVAISKYAEKRVISRSYYKLVHLGLDFTVPVGTEIFSPTDGMVHSFLSDHQNGYGNVIILSHILNGVEFYTLYGHLSDDSTKSANVGEKIVKGQRFAEIGSPDCNGNWPPHLHLQIIADMLGNFGDFPGTCTLDEGNFYLKICLNPALLFNQPYYDLFSAIK